MNKTLSGGLEAAVSAGRKSKSAVAKIGVPLGLTCREDSAPPAQKLFVIRKSSVEDRSRFFFYAVKGSEIVERVTARSASLIWDYLEANWPAGTRIYWIIL